MAPPDQPWRATDTGLVLRVRLTPKSSRDAVDGIEATAEGPAIKARVRAVPEEGAANTALERLLADWLDVGRRDVELIAGGKSRVKSLAITGAADVLAMRIEELLAGYEDGKLRR
jgi:uncharacterized protein (TIGR00251 family)